VEDRLSDRVRPAKRQPIWFWPLLIGLVLIAAGLRLVMLVEFYRENPISHLPWTDSKEYWEMAGEIAAGKWIRETPFLAAPLYPYLLGLLRSAGGGLATVCAAQLVMHLATAALIAWATRRRFGPLAGLIGAALFLALTEPAVSSSRVLGNTLQLLLVTLVWWRWSALAQTERPTWRGAISLGVLVGLLALAYPPALLLVPAVVVWLLWSGSAKRRRWGTAAAAAAAAVITISPATLHNGAVSGEFIPITAHAGITLRQGNGPASHGVYTYVLNISPVRSLMHRDAARVFEAAKGRTGSWREIDQFFRAQVYTYWFHHPGATLALFGQKLWWFLTSMNYDEMMPVVLEREYGINDTSILAPLPTPWLIGAALVGLIALLRRPWKAAPDWIVLGLPLLVTVLFFYSPRYRLPAVPVLCGLAAYALTNLRRTPLPTPAAVILCLIAVALTFVNRATGFDSPAIMRDFYRQMLSTALTRQADAQVLEGNAHWAGEIYQRALQVAPDNWFAHRQVGHFRYKQGRFGEAVEALRQSVRLYPQPREETATAADVITFRLLADARLRLDRFEGGAWALKQAVALQPDDAATRLAYAWLLATCPDDAVRNGAMAVEQAEAARALSDPPNTDVLEVLSAALAEAGRFDEAAAIAQQAAESARAANDAERVIELEERVARFRWGRPWRAPPRFVDVPFP